MGPKNDPWQTAEQSKVVKEVGQAHEASTLDELRPMHPKDTKPPPECDGARKNFMPWHESFMSMLRLRSAKRSKIIDWLKAKREKMLLDGQSKADFLAYSQTHRSDEYIEKNFDIFSKHLYRYLLDFTLTFWPIRRAACSRHTVQSCTGA